jgi:hypothetical protein
VRWDGLFADLEAQALALAVAERNAEIDERTRAEAGLLNIADRLRPSIGASIGVRCAGGLHLSGRVRLVGSEWLLLVEGSGREAVVATAAIWSVAGLGRLSATADSIGLVETRLGMRHVLRGIVRDRSVVRLHLRDGVILDGTVDRVGGDFLELAMHAAGELRRRKEVREVMVVALAAVVALRRDDLS